MTIGINAAAALKEARTGVEEYTYQLLKHLTMLEQAKEHRFLLYAPHYKAGSSQAMVKEALANGGFDFSLPPNFKIKELRWGLPMWTQIRLSASLIFKKPDVLFIPVHVLPFIHPKNSVVCLHGVEYEYYPEMYPVNHFRYLRWSTKYAVLNAKKIIAASENTKNDLIKFYNAEPKKIEVIYHGVEPPASLTPERNNLKKKPLYLLYVGRIELKKNILGILNCYKILKEKYKIPHKLMLAGTPGFGHEKIRQRMLDLGYWDFGIIELGYVSEQKKWDLLSGADAFLFPSFYEGFGLPILEAQVAGVPVVTSNSSSVPEVVGRGGVTVDPSKPEEMAEFVYKIIDDKSWRDKLIKLGRKNAERFGWEKCAKETLAVLASM